MAKATAKKKPASKAPARKAPKAGKPAASKAPVQVPAPARSPEEVALAAMYADETAAPLAAHREFRDQRTTDEDRPMIPEVTARDERQKQWDARRDHRDGRRGRRDRHSQNGRDHGNPREQRQGGHADPSKASGGKPHGGPPPSIASAGTANPRSTLAPRTELPSHQSPTNPAPPARDSRPATEYPAIGHAWAHGATQVFIDTRQPHPVPTRQLAAMMRKRDLLAGDPERIATSLKHVLWADERAHRARGQRPPVVYRGRDVFAPGARLLGATAREEHEVAKAMANLETAGKRALAARLTTLPSSAFEGLAELLALSLGFTQIEWVKRVDGIAYASAMRGGEATMISARGGDAPLDRRAIGEFRVGMSINGVAHGTLLSLGGPSEESRREMERGGPGVALLVGNEFLDALWRSGLVTHATFAPIWTLDESVFDEWK